MTQSHTPSTGSRGRLREPVTRWLRDFRDGGAADQDKRFTFTLSPASPGHNKSPNRLFRTVGIRIREDPEHAGEMLVEVYGPARVVQAAARRDPRRDDLRWRRDDKGRWLPRLEDAA